jgi:hypothetical protein
MAGDTSAEAQRVCVASYASLSGSERVERSMAMADEVKEVTLAGIRHRHPDWTDADAHREWLCRLHGPVVAAILE